MSTTDPRTVYETLIAEITDEDERKVFDALLKAGDQFLTRADLVAAVYGPEIKDGEEVTASDDLAESSKDRKVREIVRRLRERDYPIVSSSDHAGYSMKGSAEDMEKFIAQQRSRIEKLQANIDHAYRSKDKIHLVRSYRDEMPKPVQSGLFGQVERQEA